MKTCTKCKVSKPLSEYYVITKRGRKCNPSRCKECHREIAKKWNKDNRGKANERQKLALLANPEKERNRLLNNRLKRMYGISLEQYRDLAKQQGGVCRICGNPPNGHRLSVDHCHSGRGVRGLLCEGCNAGLGAFKDNPHILIKAKEYLEIFYGNKA